MGGLGEGSGALQDTAPSLSPAPQLTFWPKARVPGGPPGEGQDPPYLTFPQRTTNRLTGRRGPLTGQASGLALSRISGLPVTVAW